MTDYDTMEQIDMLECKIDSLEEELEAHGDGKCIHLTDLRNLWEESKEEAKKEYPNGAYEGEDMYIQVEAFERKLKELEARK